MRYTAVVLLVFVSDGLFAQAYRPILSNSVTWQDNYRSADLGPGVSVFECYSYYLGGDTLVNDTTYRILSMTGVFSFNQATSWFSEPVSALLREDTAIHKVFIRGPMWSFERVLYDFSAGLGPYPVTYRHPTSERVVVAVDNIELFDGPHRRLTLNYGETIIEGIGSIRGFMPRRSAYPVWAEHLICHTRDGVQDHFNDIIDCLCNTHVGIPTTADRSLRVYPSPTVGLCHLEGAPPNASFRLRSMDGRSVQSGMCSSSGSVTIDMADLSAATYVVEVFNDTRSLKVKVLKE